MPKTKVKKHYLSSSEDDNKLPLVTKLNRKSKKLHKSVGLEIPAIENDNISELLNNINTTFNYNLQMKKETFQNFAHGLYY